MASFNALAAAIRERLMDEAPAPLPGFGTLRRVHVPARVETQPDGSRSLRPPKESLRLVLGQEGDADPLAFAFAKQMGLPVSQGRDVLRQNVEQLEAILAIKGEVELEGVGIVRRTDRGLLFGADPGLLSTINASYQGLTTVGTAPEAETAAEAVPLESTEVAVAIPEPSVEAEAPHLLPMMGGDGSLTPVPTLPSSDQPLEDAATDEGADEPLPFTTEAEVEVAPEEIVPADVTLDRVALPEPEPLAPEAEGETESLADIDDEPVVLNVQDLLSSDIPPTGPDPMALESAAGDNSNPDPLMAPWAQSTEQTDVPHSSVEPEAPTPEFVEDLFSAPTHAQLEADPDSGAEADAAVDDLLAGIWTTGTPRVDELGLAVPLADEPLDIEDAEYDVVAADPIPEPVHAHEPQPTGLGSPFDEPKRPDGLPTMPAGWSPSAPSEEFEYQDESPERRFPWLWIVLGIIAIVAVAAFFLWPRFVGSQVQASSDSDPAQTEPLAASPEAELASGETTEAEGDLLDEVDLPVDEMDLDANTNFPSGAAQPVTSEGAAGGRTTPEASGGGRPAPAPEAAPVAERPRVAAATSSGNSPNLTGLSSSLASALAGAAPIQLNAEGFTWVVSSLSDRAEAARYVERYRSAGFRTALIEGSLNGRPMYRIAIGQFATRDDAIRVRDRLPADIRGRDDIWTLNLADV